MVLLTESLLMLAVEVEASGVGGSLAASTEWLPKVSAARMTAVVNRGKAQDGLFIFILGGG
jgi:hypothetical protein